MRSESSIKRSVTATQAVKILEKNGVKVTERQAEEILDLLYILAKLSVNQYVNINKKVDLDKEI